MDCLVHRSLELPALRMRELLNLFPRPETRLISFGMLLCRPHAILPKFIHPTIDHITSDIYYIVCDDHQATRELSRELSGCLLINVAPAA